MVLISGEPISGHTISKSQTKMNVLLSRYDMDTSLRKGKLSNCSQSPASYILVENIYCNWSGGSAIGSLGADTGKLCFPSTIFSN